MLIGTWTAFSADEAPRLASSIAYATIFALAPLMVVVIAIAGAVLGLQNGGHGHHVAEAALLGVVRRYAGPSTAQTIAQLVTAAFNRPRDGAIAQIAGWIMFVVGARGLFGTLQSSLNDVWHVKANRKGWRHEFRSRLASFALILVLAFLLLVSVAASTLVAYAGTHYLSKVPLLRNSATLAALNGAVMFGIVTGVFGSIFKVLPDVTLRWHDVWVGAVITSALFVVGEELISLYISFAGIASAYGGPVVPSSARPADAS